MKISVLKFISKSRKGIEMNNKKVVGYYRLSSDDGDPNQESNSITNQRLLIKEYISVNPELSAMKFEELYDDGYSGASMDRPAMQNLLEMIRQKEVGCIVVKDFSRFSRDYIELGTYLEQIFPFMKIRFISIADHYDSEKLSGVGRNLESQFKGLIADFYVKDQSVKVKTAYKVKRENGEYCSGSAPFGYRINPQNKRELLIVPEEAEVIRRVFDLTLQRFSKIEICRLFNEEGIPTPLEMMKKRQKVDSRRVESGHLTWTTDMVRKILNNKSNYGCMVYGKTKINEPGTGKEIVVPRCEWKVFENHHEPIISKEIYEQAQALQIRHGTVSKNNKSNTVLSGYVMCGSCRRKLAASKAYRGHFQYSCSYAKGEKETNCFQGKMDNKILEQLVLRELHRQIEQTVEQIRMEEKIRAQRKERIHSYESQIQEYDICLQELKQKHSNNFERYHEGELTKEGFLKAKAQMEEEKERIAERKAELYLWIRNEEDALKKKNIPVEQMLQELGYEVLTRELVEKYVAGIFVYDDGRIEIEWKNVLNSAEEQ